MDMHYYIIGHGFMDEDDDKKIAIQKYCTVMTYVEEGKLHNGDITKLIALESTGQNSPNLKQNEPLDFNYSVQKHIHPNTIKEHYFIGDKDIWADMWCDKGKYRNDEKPPPGYPHNVKVTSVQTLIAKTSTVKMTTLSYDGKVNESPTTTETTITTNTVYDNSVFKLFEINDNKCFLIINDIKIVYTLSYIIKMLLISRGHDDNKYNIILHWTACRQNFNGLTNYEDYMEYWREESDAFTSITSICDEEKIYTYVMEEQTDKGVKEWKVSGSSFTKHPIPTSQNQTKSEVFPTSTLPTLIQIKD